MNKHTTLAVILATAGVLSLGATGAVTATPLAPPSTTAPLSSTAAHPRFDRLTDAIAARAGAADIVARSKWVTKAPIDDPAREATVISAAVAAAAAKGISAARATAVFTDQIEASKIVQRALFAYWQANPAAAPTTAPDLAVPRATIDAQSAIIVTELGTTASLSTSPRCLGALTKATQRTIRTAKLDVLHVTAQLRAEKSICQRR
ncbi:gamma subclass chorismate mutase AroQ [Williamsia sp. CHRR-6]|uniref:gamma subclass chorismate mutase AroQ n=1 Tax=Williamsia sp. CHRR-6 TaxID=2835871 RepID=UPI001BDB5EA1|nr:gamma subclass chorismate mutase AroQ [Williamsia sp. CHRR-6]MBT0566773.1 gamma subclass chorismate mutase AroQ [Williamsia sp. CHRR-6]